MKFIEGSVLDLNLLRNLVADKDLIFHLAARGMIASSKDPYMDLDVNIKGTLNVVESALEKAKRLKRVIYTSTSSVYGNARFLPTNEDDNVDFLNFYSVSKFAGEGYCKVYYELYDLPVTIVRYSNIYGYHQVPEHQPGVVGQFIARALSGKPLIIHGNGEQTRDFTFVEDAVEATILAGLNPKAIGRTYNVATGRETTINQLANIILEKADSSSAMVYVEERDIDNIRRRVLDIAGMRRDLKFVPKHTLEQGIEKTIEWFKKFYLPKLEGR